jgi:hypothetical protein
MRLLSSLKGRLSNVHIPGDKPDIFIFATPRSGSTFLIELLQAQPGMKIYSEIISPQIAPVRDALGISTWEELTTLPDRKAVFRRHFTRLRENRLPALNRPLYWRDARFLTRRIAYHGVWGGYDLLPWFEDELRGLIIVLLRHPIPTVQSHYVFPRLEHYLKQPDYRARFTPAEIALAERIIGEGTDFERGILDWCLQVAPMIRNPRPSWATITYEDLTMLPEESFAYLRDKLDLDPIDNLWDLVERPSNSTAYSDAETRRRMAEMGKNTDRRFFIDKWRARAGEGDERRAFEILDAFAIDCYAPGNDFATAKYRVPGVA